MIMSHTKIFSFFAIGLMAIGTVAYAAKGLENDALALTHAKISLAQAVTTAEQHVKGRASHAEYEQTKSGWAYDVEVVSGNAVFDVTVDAEKGNVIASARDVADHDDDQDEKD
jgi:uncharacterized membrane protein YkoI